MIWANVDPDLCHHMPSPGQWVNWRRSISSGNSTLSFTCHWNYFKILWHGTRLQMINVGHNCPTFCCKFYLQLIPEVNVTPGLLQTCSYYTPECVISCQNNVDHNHCADEMQCARYSLWYHLHSGWGWASYWSWGHYVMLPYTVHNADSAYILVDFLWFASKALEDVFDSFECFLLWWIWQQGGILYQCQVTMIVYFIQSCPSIINIADNIFCFWWKANISMNISRWNKTILYSCTFTSYKCHRRDGKHSFPPILDFIYQELLCISAK